MCTVQLNYAQPIVMVKIRIPASTKQTALKSTGAVVARVRNNLGNSTYGPQVNIFDEPESNETSEHGDQVSDASDDVRSSCNVIYIHMPILSCFSGVTCAKTAAISCLVNFALVLSATRVFPMSISTNSILSGRSSAHLALCKGRCTGYG